MSDFTDSTDWLGTPLHALAPVDSALRCQICKDFYTNAVSTTCSHTFCSLCIRRALSADGRCPTCRSTDSEIKLKRNITVQEICDAFVLARPEAIKAAREVAAEKEDLLTRQSSKKRKRGADPAEQEAPRTRAQRRRAAAAPTDIPSTQDSLNTDATGQTDDPSAQEANDDDPEYVPEDGLVACPICGNRMKEELVFGHLNTCDGTKKSSPAPPFSSSTAPPSSIQPQRQDQPPLERLPQLNYSLFNENKLRQKLAALGIPSWGKKELLAKRHTEWINLWNSNCDATRPRTKRDLLRDLAAWENSQGGHARDAAAGGQVMKKDFDGAGWARRNKSDFDDLIAQARARSKATKKADEPQASTSESTRPDDTSSSSDPQPLHAGEDSRASQDKPHVPPPLRTALSLSQTPPQSAGGESNGIQALRRRSSVGLPGSPEFLRREESWPKTTTPPEGGKVIKAPMFLPPSHMSTDID